MILVKKTKLVQIAKQTVEPAHPKNQVAEMRPVTEMKPVIIAQQTVEFVLQNQFAEILSVMALNHV